jgi:L-threonylcarbamoyladenylate synthase
MMSQYLQWDKKEDINKVINALRAGNAIVGSSDTVLGIFTNSTYEGFLSLNSLKGRFEKPYLLLIKSRKQASRFVNLSVLLQIEKILNECWPGPLTIIMPAKKDVPDYMKSKEGMIALRVPQHKGLQEVLSHFNALFSTSANKAGEPIPNSCNDIDPAILQSAPLCITDNTNAVIPSTIIQWSDLGLKLIRKGAYGVDDLERILQKKLLPPD